jgi:hypothetical protein
MEKEFRPSGLRLKTRHSSLLAVHFESPKISPRASIGAFSGATAPTQIALTGPLTVF